MTEAHGDVDEDGLESFEGRPPGLHRLEKWRPLCVRGRAAAVHSGPRPLGAAAGGTHTGARSLVRSLRKPGQASGFVERNM